MEFKLHNGSGGLCCKSCCRQDKQLNTYDWLADIPGNRRCSVFYLVGSILCSKVHRSHYEVYIP